MSVDTSKVAVHDLRVLGRGASGTEVPILTDVSFSIARGEVLALIGESGSGKTTAGLTLLGYARHGCRIGRGEIRVGSTNVLALGASELAEFRGRKVSYVAQSAAAAFNPAHKIIDQVIEPALIHHVLNRKTAEDKACQLFRALSLPNPDSIGERYPHQVSGGQLQRLMAAMALINEPELVILDEPTTALDVTTQIDVLQAFKRVVRDLGTTALYISHDLSVVAQIADRVAVMRYGHVLETGPIGDVIVRPNDTYTRSLLAAAHPQPRTTATVPEAQPLLEVSGLSAGYGRQDSAGRPPVPVLCDINFAIPKGSIFGVIGESGCGKSTLAQVVAGLLPASTGVMRLNGVDLRPKLAQRTRAELQAIQIVFQMADVSLNPARTVGAILGRPLSFYHGMHGEARRRRVTELLDMVHLSPDLAARYPGALSGGQKQRVNLARALAAEPSLILCDEVTSALDTVVGAAILDLLAELRRSLGVAVMFISHDINIVRSLCDRVMILYAGRAVEIGPGKLTGAERAHPYTNLLLNSVPELRIGWLDGIDRNQVVRAAGGVSFGDIDRPCPFFRRCPVNIPGLCDTVPPALEEREPGRLVACHNAGAELHKSFGYIAENPDRGPDQESESRIGEVVIPETQTPFEPE